MMKNNKLPYVKIWIPEKKQYEYWPYVEAKEYMVYDIPKSCIVYLTDEELKELEMKEEKKHYIDIQLDEELYNFYRSASENDKITIEDGIVAVLSSFYLAYKKKKKKRFKIGK